MIDKALAMRRDATLRLLEGDAAGAIALEKTADRMQRRAIEADR